MNLAVRWLLLGFLVIQLSGCGEQPSDEIRFAIPTAPTTLDPRLASDALGERIGRLLYAKLTDFNDRFEVVPSLASWETLSPTHYRFTLKPGRASFGDGRMLGADDVVDTYRFVLNPDNGSPHRGALSMLKRVEATGEDRIDFFLDRPDSLFPGYLSLGIVPKGTDVGAVPIGSGAFEYRAGTDPNQFVLKRRSDGQLIRFLVTRDPSMRAIKLIKGEVDLLQNELPPELVAYLGEQDGIEVQRYSGINFSYLGFNLQDPILSQLPIRQAIAMAIDRDALINYLWRGGVRPAESILGPDHWAGNPGLEPWPFDQEKARELLAEAGYGPDRPLVLEYKTTTNPFRLRIATVLQHQLAEVGIELRIRSFDWGTFFGDIKAGRFQLYSLTWVGIKSPDIFRYVFHSSAMPPHGANRGRYDSPAADELIERAESASTRRERLEAFRQVQSRVHQDLPYVPLWYEDHFVARRASISGYSVPPDGSYDSLKSIKSNR